MRFDVKLKWLHGNCFKGLDLYKAFVKIESKETFSSRKFRLDYNAYSYLNCVFKIT